MVVKGRFGGFAVLAFVLSTSLACQDKEAAVRPDPNAGLTQAQRADKEIAAIEQNPTISDKSKQMAISQIRAHSGGGMKPSSGP
jgi:hypothetical protein